MSEKAQRRILILSFYYPPDLCAGSFRIEAFIKALLPMAEAQNFTIDVMTTQPNRYHDFHLAAPTCENHARLTIHRITLPEHHSGFIDQAKAFSRYFFEAQKLVKEKNYDLVYATSSRLFTAFLGARLSQKKKAKLFLDMRDIFTETMEDILKFPFCLALPIFKWIERYTLKKANALNLVSPGFSSYFQGKINPNCSLYFISNGIDACFEDINFSSNQIEKAEKNNIKKRIVYAGNFGEGQGLEKIIPELAQASLGRAEFYLIGSGGKLEILKAACKTFSNVFFLAPVSREELIKHYKKADILFLHLNQHPAFRRVLPSKIFEYAITGKPILAGLLGYSAEFMSQQVRGTYLFSSCDISQALAQLERVLSDEKTSYDRSDFCKKFNRKDLMQELASHVVSLLNSPKSQID